MKPAKNDPQGLGSAITYQRRYALGAILGLNIDIDDDGNAASTQPKKQSSDDKPWLNPNTENWIKSINACRNGYTIDDVKSKYKISKDNEKKLLEELR